MWIDWILVSAGLGLLAAGLALLVKWMMFWREEGMAHAKIKAQDRLITYGIYGYARHPHYLSVMLICIGFSFLSLCLFNPPFPSSILPFVPSIFILLYFYFLAIKEEKNLIERFGKEYLEYKKNVPMFIPRIFHARRESDRK